MESLTMPTTTDEKATPCPAQVRDLMPEEIATLDVDTVAKNNSASAEELMKRLSHTSTPD